MGFVSQGSVWTKQAAFREAIDRVARYPVALSSILGIGLVVLSHVGALRPARSVKIDTATQTVRGEARPARRSLHAIRYKSNRDLTIQPNEPMRVRY